MLQKWVVNLILIKTVTSFCTSKKHSYNRNDSQMYFHVVQRGVRSVNKPYVKGVWRGTPAKMVWYGPSKRWTTNVKLIVKCHQILFLHFVQPLAQQWSKINVLRNDSHYRSTRMHSTFWHNWVALAGSTFVFYVRNITKSVCTITWVY